MTELETELRALSLVVDGLKLVDQEATERIIAYVQDRFVDNRKDPETEE